jgi:hypothetical protein
MKKNSYRNSIWLLMIMILLTACGRGQSTAKPPVTPTEITTVVPSETSVPNLASLGGTIFLSDNNKNPFPTSGELRLKYGGPVTNQLETNSVGEYMVEKIQPGSYEFWILITADSSMVTGCSDLLPPDDSWQVWIKYGEEKAVGIAENVSLSRALEEALFMLENYGLQADGFYAVFPDLEIQPGLEYKMDVVLMCK